METEDVAHRHKWYELGLALHIPIEILEKLYDKYSANPMEGLIRVYRYWLSEKNNLKPTWDKLIAALNKIHEYRIAASVAVNLKVGLFIQ